MAQFTKYTGTVTGQTGSLITALNAVLETGEGWTKPYTATNGASYKQAAGNQFHFEVQDNASQYTSDAKTADIRGWETLSAFNTGTGKFPTVAQGYTYGMLARKSASADGTTRAYKAWADDRTVYFFMDSGDSAGYYTCFGFGDLYSYLTADGYRTFITGNGSGTPSLSSERMCYTQANISSAGDGFYVARSHLGTGGSVLLGRHSDYAKQQGNAFAGIVPYSNPSDGGLYLARVTIHDPVTSPANSIRGRLRGLWVPLHAVTNFADGDTFSGTGSLAGKTFEMVKSVSGAGTQGVAVIETSDTLDTN